MKWGGFIDGVEEFDAAVLRHLRPREARGMDPQQRLLLRRAGRRSSMPAMPRRRCLARRGRRVHRHVRTAGYADLLRRPRLPIEAYYVDRLRAGIASEPYQPLPQSSRPEHAHRYGLFEFLARRCTAAAGIAIRMGHCECAHRRRREHDAAAGRLHRASTRPACWRGRPLQDVLVRERTATRRGEGCGRLVLEAALRGPARWRPHPAALSAAVRRTMADGPTRSPRPTPGASGPDPGGLRAGGH